MNRKGPWEGYRRQAKRRLARCLLPAFLCAHIFIDRETSGYEAAVAISCLEFQEKIYLTSLVDPYCIETVRLYKV